MGIEVRNLQKSFGPLPQVVLRGLCFSIKDGEFVSIMGKSGCGKSTLLYQLSTLDSPTSGEVLIDGKNIERLSEEELHRFRNESMGFVFQFHYLLPELNALENVLMPARRTKTHIQRSARAKSLLEEFGLGKKFESFPSELSGGERQRIAIARALIMEPRYIFADEPTGNLDSVNGEIILNIFEKTSKETGATVIYVTHDPDFAARATRQIQMHDGKIV
jgi:ABC-type lipoprotein export system ATPase subunit